MDDAARRSLKFTVTFNPALTFLTGLLVMRMMAASAALVVKNGCVQVMAFSQDRKAVSTLTTEASTDFSLPSNCFSIQFDLQPWINSLLEPIFSHATEPLRIFKMCGCFDLHSTVGQDCIPVKLSEAVFAEENGIDIRKLRTHSVTLNLRTKLLRDVVTEFAACSRVLMTVFEDKVLFTTSSQESDIFFLYEAGENDCATRGVSPNTSAHLTMVWREAQALNNAAKLTEEVLICPLVDQQWMHWILFGFRIDDTNYFSFMIQGDGAVAVAGAGG